ncbi:unnamed protein product [Prorocentrum cordatum]|uniref:Uncharacterized protein n=1 Tax=Prorocentrum cordatum TaxID=2364126 RepID=A0ABN9V8C0_9DINO|nr:unnamed protein product [Polarella glacialis]
MFLTLSWGAGSFFGQSCGARRAMADDGGFGKVGDCHWRGDRRPGTAEAPRGPGGLPRRLFGAPCMIGPPTMGFAGRTGTAVRASDTARMAAAASDGHHRQGQERGAAAVDPRLGRAPRPAGGRSARAALVSCRPQPFWRTDVISIRPKRKGVCTPGGKTCTEDSMC